MASQAKYVHDLMTLFDVVGLLRGDGGPVELRPESSMMDSMRYSALAARLTPRFVDYLNETDLYGVERFESMSSYQALRVEGWWASIDRAARLSPEQYGRHYDADPQTATTKLAEYFAGSLARYQLRGVGALSHWDSSFLQLNFAQPAPGIPPAIGTATSTRGRCRTRFARTPHAALAC